MLREATAAEAGPLVVRARAARAWGRAATLAHDWHQASEALGAAVELAGLAVPLELGRADQERRLGRVASGLGTAAAAVSVQAGDPARAVELFDQQGVPHGPIRTLDGFGIHVLPFRDPDNIQIELTAPVG